MRMLSGYILARPGIEIITQGELGRYIEDSKGAFSLEFDETLALGNAWESFTFTSSIPLPEDNQRAGAEPSHSCKIVICRSRSRMLLMAERRKISDFVIDNFLNSAIYPNFRKVPISIDEFIGACSIKENPYAITSMHGRFSGPERALRTVILYGDEVTDSSLFRQQHDLFNFYSAGVRRRVDRISRAQAYDDPEIARIGNDGLLSANFKDSERASEVLRLVKYVFENKWVESWAKGEQ